MPVKLGKKAPIPGLKVPKMGTYLKRAVPPPPPVLDRFTGVPFGMFMNNQLGCCTISAIANTIAQRTRLSQGVPVIMPDETVVKIYSHVTGYNPANPDSDQGAVETDVLAWFAREGVSLRQQSLEVGTWAALDNSPSQIRESVYLFGSAYIGLALPIIAQNQTVWDVKGPLRGDAAPGSWGGHAVPIVGYDVPKDLYTVATWGAPKGMTGAFMKAYMDESYAVFSPGEWLNTTGLSPDHFDFEALLHDHKQAFA